MYRSLLRFRPRLALLAAVLGAACYSNDDVAQDTDAAGTGPATDAATDAATGADTAAATGADTTADTEPAPAEDTTAGADTPPDTDTTSGTTGDPGECMPAIFGRSRFGEACFQ